MSVKNACPPVRIRLVWRFQKVIETHRYSQRKRKGSVDRLSDVLVTTGLNVLGLRPDSEQLHGIIVSRKQRFGGFNFLGTPRIL